MAREDVEDAFIISLQICDSIHNMEKENRYILKRVLPLRLSVLLLMVFTSKALLARPGKTLRIALH